MIYSEMYVNANPEFQTDSNICDKGKCVADFITAVISATG